MVIYVGFMEGQKDKLGGVIDDLSHRVLGCAIEVHRTLGPGLLESTYQRCLSRELDLNHIEHECEAKLPIDYKGVSLDCGYRLDILVRNELIIELKCVKRIEAIHEAQIITYLKLSGLKKGFILNFHDLTLKKGLKSFVL